MKTNVKTLKKKLRHSSNRLCSPISIYYRKHFHLQHSQYRRTKSICCSRKMFRKCLGIHLWRNIRYSIFKPGKRVLLFLSSLPPRNSVMFNRREMEKTIFAHFLRIYYSTRLSSISLAQRTKLSR